MQLTDVNEDVKIFRMASFLTPIFLHNAKLMNGAVLSNGSLIAFFVRRLCTNNISEVTIFLKGRAKSRIAALFAKATSIGLLNAELNKSDIYQAFKDKNDCNRAFEVLKAKFELKAFKSKRILR